MQNDSRLRLQHRNSIRHVSVG